MRSLSPQLCHLKESSPSWNGAFRQSACADTLAQVFQIRRAGIEDVMWGNITANRCSGTLSEAEMVGRMGLIARRE
jgi:hypothetical protein